MKTLERKSSYSLIEFVLIIVVVSMIGIIGYTFYINQNNNQLGSSTTQSPTADDVKVAPDITSTNDLDKALKIVDDTDLSNSNNSDIGQLDSQVSDF